METEEIATTSEAECSNSHNIDSYSVSDEQSNYLSSGSSLVDDCCCSEYGAEQEYHVEDFGSQSLNENIGNNNCYF